MPRKITGPRDLATDREIWERQPGESSTAYKYFLGFRDMGGGRSIKGAISLLGKPGTTLRPHAYREQWVKRAVAWDDHLQREKDAQQIQSERDAVDGMVQRHLNIVQTIERVATVELMRYAHQVQADQANPDVQRDPIMSFETLRKAFDFAMNNEAKIRGVPTYGWEALPEDDTLNSDTGAQIDLFEKQTEDARRSFDARAAKQLEEPDPTLSIEPVQEKGSHVVLPADVLRAVDLSSVLEDDDG